MTTTIPGYEKAVAGQKGEYSFISSDTGKAIANFIDVAISALGVIATHGLAALGITSAMGIAKGAGVSPGQLAVGRLSKDQYGNLVISSAPSEPSKSSAPSTPSNPSPSPSLSELGLNAPSPGGFGESLAPSPSLVSSSQALSKVLSIGEEGNLTDALNSLKSLYSTSISPTEGIPIPTPIPVQQASMGSVLGIFLIVGVVLTFFFKRGA